ncbi:proline-rich transmembrane protein 1-like [Ptychodera flava]|uniref:proline-rich transmembrane protein 1-like n=1 Tax=Ptychodera flava TaxID=63121 RepID=UPI003969C783
MSEERERLVGGGGGVQSRPEYQPTVYDVTAQPVQVCPGQGQQHVRYVHIQKDFSRPMNNPPNDHLVLAILACIFCFWPLGLVAIIKALDVHHAVLAGDLERATDSANKANEFAVASIVLGIFIIIPGSILLALLIDNY